MPCSICFKHKKLQKYCCSEVCNKCFLKLKGLCPVCERDKINEKVSCEKCLEKFTMVDINNCSICKRNICSKCSKYRNEYIHLCKMKCIKKYLDINFKNLKIDIF